MKKIWFDITNTPQVHTLCSIRDALAEKRDDFSFVFSAREFSETTQLLRKKIGDDFHVIGSHYGKNPLMKSFGVISRFLNVYNTRIPFDISISNGSESAIWTAWLKRKRSIAFGDNDTAKQWTYGRFVDFAFFPDAIPEQILTRQGISRSRLYRYNGFKEDIYLAGFSPDPGFPAKLPFRNYVVVRPENILANYLDNSDNHSITPKLVSLLSEKGYNVLFLPRYKFDRDYVAGIKNIFIPEEAVNGLDACYYADAVLTGAGTLAREAACLGVPSVSFYAGKTLLAVDREMISRNWMFHSRDPHEIVERMAGLQKREAALERSRKVRDEVATKLIDVITSF